MAHEYDDGGLVRAFVWNVLPDAFTIVFYRQAGEGFAMVPPIENPTGCEPPAVSGDPPRLRVRCGMGMTLAYPVRGSAGDEQTIEAPAGVTLGEPQEIDPRELLE